MSSRGKRDLASLSFNSIDRRHQIYSQKSHYYANTQSQHATPPKVRSIPEAIDLSPHSPRLSKIALPLRPRPTGKAAARQRVSIQHLFQDVFGSPPQETWIEDRVIPNIMKRLDIHEGSWNTVRRILLDVIADPKHDAAEESPGKGRKPLVTDGTPQANNIYNLLERGNSVGTATILLNEGYRARNRMGPISYAAVQRFINCSPVIHAARRQTKKSGKDDMDTVWSQARLAISAQWLEMIELGKLTPEERAARQSPFPPLYLDGLSIFDEKHKKVKLGHSSRMEYRIRRDAAGNAVSEDAGGVLPPPMPNTTMKFPGEARGLFGVAMVKKEDGNYVGKRAEPFNYTGCKIVSFKDYEAACQACMDHVRKLKSRPWDYEKKYGAGTPALAAALRLAVRQKKMVSVKELIDHCISQSIAMFAGTAHANDFFIFHDALSLWWTPEAQEYIAQLGFKDRQLRSIDPTNVGNRYEGKVPGDSPEFGRGTDSHGFAHMEKGISLMSSITSVLPVGDPHRFDLGTPNALWSTMSRVWQYAPTSDQICEDILGLPRVLKRIIEVEGCIVTDESTRSGRRARRADDKGDLTSRKRRRQRKETNVYPDLHPDCAPAIAILEAGCVGAMVGAVAIGEGDEHEPGNKDAAMESPDEDGLEV